MDIILSPNRIFIACGYTDMRKSIDRLSGIVAQQFRLNVFDSALFLFCGRRRYRFKALLWRGDGFVLLYKRLESGRYQWPNTDDVFREIDPRQYRWLLEGLSIDQPKAVQRIMPKACI